MMSRTRARPLLAADMASARRMRNDAGDRDGKEEAEGGSKGQEYWLGGGVLCVLQSSPELMAPYSDTKNIFSRKPRMTTEKTQN